MKRWLGAVHRGVTCGVVGLAICCMVGGWATAVRTQLKYGYAVDRSGNRYSVWTMPSIFLAIVLAAGAWFLIQTYLARRAWDAGRGPAQAITYPLPKQGARKRTRKRRRKK